MRYKFHAFQTRELSGWAPTGTEVWDLDERALVEELDGMTCDVLEEDVPGYSTLIFADGTELTAISNRHLEAL